MKALGRIQLNLLLVPKEITESREPGWSAQAWWREETQQEYVEMRSSEETQEKHFTLMKLRVEQAPSQVDFKI